MLVPGPVGRQDEIIGPERDLVAVDIGEGALTLHDEAERRGAVPVARGALAGRHDLEPGIEPAHRRHDIGARSEEHTSELQSLMRISYAVFCLKKKTKETNAQNVSRHKM